MKVYRIWNTTKQTWYASGKRSYWPTLKGARMVLNSYSKWIETYKRYSKKDFYPEVLIIKEFELCNEKEIL